MYGIWSHSLRNRLDFYLNELRCLCITQPLLPLEELPHAQIPFTAETPPHSYHSAAVRKLLLATSPTLQYSSLKSAALRRPKQDAVDTVLTGNVAVPYVSLTPFRGSLSSRIRTKLAPRNMSPPVHSRKSICATASGFNHIIPVITSAVIPRPQRPAVG